MAGIRIHGIRIAIIAMIQASGVLMLMTGCIVPAQRNKDPDFFNNAPRVIPRFPEVTEGPFAMDVDCESYSFLAVVEDPDPDDTVYWRYFLDYHDDTTSKSTQIRPERDTALQAAPITFPVRPSDFPDSDPVVESTFHTVELFAADRRFFDQAEPLGRVVEDDGKTDSFVWPVRLLPSDGFCDQEAVQ